jgi:CBS-domain-containing membrane protein
MNRICWKDVENALKDLDEDINEEEIEKIMKVHEKKSE